MTKFQTTLDEEGQERFDKIKNKYEITTDQGVFVLLISLAAELADHIDGQGYIHLVDGTRIKVRGIS